jgi:hypothetical protein
MILLDKSRRSTGIATLMRNYRTGLFRGTTSTKCAWLPDLYPWIEPVEIRTGRFATSKQTMIYQDTQRFVRWLYERKTR